MDVWQDIFPNFFYAVGINEYRIARDNIVPLQSASIDYALGWFEGEMFNVINDDFYSFHPAMNFERLRWGVESASRAYKFPEYRLEDAIAVSMQLIALNEWIRIDNDNITINVTVNGEKKNSIYMRKKIVSLTNGIGLGIPPKFELVTSLMPVGSYLGSKAENEGATVLLADRKRTGPFLSYKAFSNYQLSIVTRADVRLFNERIQKDGLYENMQCEDALFVQPDGTIIEGTGENIGILKDNTFITPGYGKGCLPGITMWLSKCILKSMGIKIKTKRFTLEDIMSSDMVILTGNYAGIVTVSGIVISKDLNPQNAVILKVKNKRPEIYQELCSKYNALKSDPLLNEKLSEWLSKENIKFLNEKGREFKKKYSEMNNFVLSDDQMNFEVRGKLKLPIIAKPPKDFSKKISLLKNKFKFTQTLRAISSL